MTADHDRLAAARQALAAATGSVAAARPKGDPHQAEVPAAGRFWPTEAAERASDRDGDPSVGREADREADRDADPATVARAIVLRQLAMGPRSRAQLERKLAQRGCDPQIAATVLDRLSEIGLVDDAAFADQLVHSRRRTKGLAGAALIAELREKGIDPEVARDAIGGVDPQSERARAEDLAVRKLASMAGLAPQVQARRLGAMLARKGYGSGTVYSVVRDVIENAPEHQRD
ncbi:MAG TPA: regulatory protein RecX [Dermatophilaceae bacterium]|nr:regulatory protein RecX [Dermatophilaceae bacterium]HMT91168.1 regulatory protein RecX [Dermatophilaceae bacterium]